MVESRASWLLSEAEGCLLVLGLLDIKVAVLSTLGTRGGLSGMVGYWLGLDHLHWLSSLNKKLLRHLEDQLAQQGILVY